MIEIVSPSKEAMRIALASRGWMVVVAAKAMVANAPTRMGRIILLHGVIWHHGTARDWKRVGSDRSEVWDRSLWVCANGEKQ